MVLQEFLSQYAARPEGAFSLLYAGLLLPEVRIAAADTALITAVTPEGKRWTLSSAALLGFAVSQAEAAARPARLLEQPLPDWLSKEHLWALVNASLQNFPRCAGECGTLFERAAALWDAGNDEDFSVLAAEVDRAAGNSPECGLPFAVIRAMLELAGGYPAAGVQRLLANGLYPEAACAAQQAGLPQAFDLLGWYLNDEDIWLGEEQDQALCRYARCCLEQEDCSLLMEILWGRLELEGETPFLQKLTAELLDRLAPGHPAEEGDFAENLRALEAACQVPADCTSARCEQTVRQLYEPVQTPWSGESGPAGADEYTQEEEAAWRQKEAQEQPPYYNASIHRILGYRQYMLAVNGREVYLNGRQIADPLLRNLLAKNEADCQGLPVHFLFSSNKRGLCAAQVVLPRPERARYLAGLGPETSLETGFEWDAPIPQNGYCGGPGKIFRNEKERLQAVAPQQEADYSAMVAYLTQMLWKGEALDPLPEEFRADPVSKEALEEFSHEASAEALDRLQQHWEECGKYPLLLQSLRAGLRESDPLYQEYRPGGDKTKERPVPQAPELSKEELWKGVLEQLAAREYVRAAEQAELWQKAFLRERGVPGPQALNKASHKRQWEKSAAVLEYCRCRQAGQPEELEACRKALWPLLTGTEQGRLPGLAPGAEE